MLQIYLTIIDDENEKSRFEELYERYARLMHYAARGILADDRLAEEAVQEAFFRIARNFHNVGDVKSSETKNFAVLITRRMALTIAETELRHGKASEAVSEGAGAGAGRYDNHGGRRGGPVHPATGDPPCSQWPSRRAHGIRKYHFRRGLSGLRGGGYLRPAVPGAPGGRTAGPAAIPASGAVGVRRRGRLPRRRGVPLRGQGPRL